MYKPALTYICNDVIREHLHVYYVIPQIFCVPLYNRRPDFIVW